MKKSSRAVSGLTVSILAGGLLLASAAPAHAAPSACTASTSSDGKTVKAKCVAGSGFLRAKGYCDSSAGGGWLYGPWEYKAASDPSVVSYVNAGSACRFNYASYETA